MVDNKTQLLCMITNCALVQFHKQAMHCRSIKQLTFVKVTISGSDRSRDISSLLNKDNIPNGGHYPTPTGLENS